MAKDIEKIIESSVVPEMEYVKTKRAAAPKEVPEIVLPKTKAEMYEEAKDRLEQKTSAVSKAYKPDKRKHGAGKKPPKKQARTETVTIAPPRKTAEKTVEKTKERIKTLKRIVDEPKWVGSADELVPFAWRKPLVDVVRPTKYYRTAVREARERSMLLPVPRDK